MPKRKHNINKTLAMTLIISGAALIAIAFLLMRIETILGWIGSFLSILRPIFIGIGLTFVLYGPVKKLSALLEKATKGKRFPCNGVAIAISYVVLAGILTGIIWIVVPSFISSFEEFTGKFSTYIANIQKFLDNTLTSLKNATGSSFFEQFNLDTKAVVSQISGVLVKIPDYMPNVMEAVGQWASALTSIITDIFFGIAFSVYILVGKKRLKKQVKSIGRTFLSGAAYGRFSHYGRMIFDTFSNFVSGQLLEALILGLLCFIGMSILGFPYAIMISVIVGVTNIIPIIGPIIGTIPGAIIYLMIDPWKAIWFVIFIVIIQQIDCNLIYPRVVGSSVGLPAIWILFAITVGGGLFGVIGMVIGVPVMSLIYSILREKTAEAGNELNDAEKDNREPMFPEAREKTSRILMKIKSSVQSGFGTVLDKVDDKIHIRDLKKKLHHAENSKEDDSANDDPESAKQKAETDAIDNAMAAFGKDDDDDDDTAETEETVKSEEE